MTSESRRSIANGIWLCRSCADLIDTDPLRFTVEILDRWKHVAESRARTALSRPRIVNVGSNFADTILLVTTHKLYPVLPQNALRDAHRRRKITYRPLRAHRSLLNVTLPFVAGPSPGPRGFGTVKLMCQNQGAGVEQFVRFGLSFHGQAVIHSSEGDSERVLVSEGGKAGSSMVTFMVREILPGEVMSATVVVRNNLPFDAHLWTQSAGDSPEVFIYEVIVGDEEIVEVALPRRQAEAPELGRNDRCPCGSGKKYKKCHGVSTR